MPFQYGWKETRSGRRYTRTMVPDEPVAVVKDSASMTIDAETVPSVNEQFDAAEVVAEKPKRGRPRKVVTDE